MASEHRQSSEVLATIPSFRKHDGRRMELRVCLDHMGRHTDASIRLWIANEAGVMEPVPRVGLNFRKADLPEVIDGLILAEERMC